MSEIVTATFVATKNGKTKRQAFEAMLGQQLDAVAKVAAKDISASRLVQVAVGAAMRNPLLFECDFSTVLRCLLASAELGLGIGAEQEAHLVPMRNNKADCYECQLFIDYRGLLKLVWQSSIISSIDFGVVYQGDEFSFRKGTEVELSHVPNFDRELPRIFWPNEDNPQAESRYAMIRCVYAAAKTITGGKVAIVLTRSQVDRYRQMSRAKDKEFWTGHWEAMAIKTAIRQLCKYLPKSTSLVRAVAIDDAAETGDYSTVAFEMPEIFGEAEPESLPTRGMDAAKASLKAKNAADAQAEDQPEEPYNGPTVTQDQPEGALL